MKPVGIAIVWLPAAIALVSAAQNAATQPDPGIDLNCVYDRLQNPPDSFHYVYKKDAYDGFPVDQEADITPQTSRGAIRGSSGRRC
jgi:hypothetical protein